MILRFFALSHDAANYKKPLSAFLNTFAQDFRSIDGPTYQQWKEKFDKTCAIARSLLGRYAFRTFTPQGVPSASMNAALFDAEMVGISRVLPDVTGLTADQQRAFLAELRKLLDEPVFQRAISASTSDELLVRGRIDRFERFLREYRFG